MSAPRILWISPHALHDSSSGAAFHVRTMLEKFRERGVEVRAVSGLIFDTPTGTAYFPNLEEELQKPDMVLTFTENDIPYYYLKTRSRSVSDLMEREMRSLFSLYGQLLHDFRPDVCVMFGGGMLEICIRAEAQRRGIPFVYTLCNANHNNYGFAFCDLVMCDSQATANLYGQRNRINVWPAGAFVRPENVITQERTRRYVTFINPEPQKGVSLFARLALMAQEELPDTRFLVVQSRGDWFNIVPNLTFADGTSLSPQLFPNVDVHKHTTDIRQVYALSSLVLAPSLAWESSGRVVVESLLNGIPLLTSQSGGLPEFTGEGGISLPIPSSYTSQNLLQLPSEEDVRPWMDALKQMLDDLPTWEARAQQAGKVHDIEHSTDRALALMAPLFQRKASLNPQYYLAGSLVQGIPQHQAQPDAPFIVPEEFRRKLF